MQITVIGSGGWEGIPAPFCRCRVCRIAPPNSKNSRTRPQFLFETSKGRFLTEISPDIRMQSASHDLQNISDFVVSHWHFDHMYGLMELDAWSWYARKGKIKVYCSQKTKEWLDKNFEHVPKDVVIVNPFRKFDLLGIKITPFPLYHMKWDKNVPLDKLKNVFGFVFEKGKKKVVYLPDYYRIPDKSINLVKNPDVVIMDGTFLFEEIFPDKPEQRGAKNDPDHLHGKQILDLAASLNAKKTVFHSITHLTEKTHSELQKMLPKGMFLSYDGMKISL